MGSPIFIVIHGTWATGASWTNRESTLICELINKWPDAGIYRFQWSGVNSAKARISAAHQLAARLKEKWSGSGSPKLFAVAHSHGGNIVAWASTQLTASLAGAIYLNTPFIQALDEKVEHFVILRIFMLAGSAGMVSLGAQCTNWLQDTDYWYLLIPLWIAIVVLSVLLQKVLPKRLDLIRKDLIKLSNSYRNINRELVVSVMGDEASAFLSSLYFFHWLERRMRPFLLILLILSWLPSVQDLFGNGWSGIIVMSLIAGILTSSILFSSSAYGVVQGLISLDSLLSVTPSPVGDTDFATVPWSKRDTLRHSLIYRSEDAISLIMRWAEQVLSLSESRHHKLFSVDFWQKPVATYDEDVYDEYSDEL